MIWLLALACGDKDDSPRDSEASDSPVGDSPTDTGDSSSVDPHCDLGPMSPLTVPIEGAEVVFHYACTGTSMAQVATSEGAWACEQEGSTLVCQTGAFGEAGVKEVVLTDTEGATWGPGRLHVHTEPVLEAPEGLVQAATSGTVVHLGEQELLVLDEDALRRVQLDGTVDKEFALASEKLCSDCWTQGSPQGVVGVDGQTVHVVTLDGQDSTTLELDTVLDASLHEDGPRAVGRVKSSDRGESVYATDLGTGKIWSLGQLDGEVRILDDAVVEAACEKEQLVLTDLDWSTGKELSSASGPFECWPTTWKVALMDVDGDGHEDQVHALEYEDSQQLGVRLADGKGGFGDTQQVQHPELAYSSFRFDEGLGRVLYDDHAGRTWSGSLEEGESSTVAVENPTFVGHPGSSSNVLGQLRPNPSGPRLARTEQALYLLTGEEWILANNDQGASLVRVKESGSFYLSFQVAGKEVQGWGEAHAAALYGERSLFFKRGDVLYDEKALSSGGDFEISPVGESFEGHALLAWRNEAGELGLTLLDLEDPADDEGRLRQNPDTLVGEWDALIDDQLESLHANPLAAAGPPAGVASEAPYPSAVATVAWDTGTACPYATVLVPGVHADMEANWELAQVLATSEQPDCADLARPLGSADLYGDGGSVVLLSDGTQHRLLEFQIPEKVVVEKEDDFYGMQSGDFNGDGLADMVLWTEPGERLLWLSDGEGGGLEHEVELEDWLEISRQVGAAPGSGSPPVTLFSWGLVLD